MSAAKCIVWREVCSNVSMNHLVECFSYSFRRTRVFQQYTCFNLSPYSICHFNTICPERITELQTKIAGTHSIQKFVLYRFLMKHFFKYISCFIGFFLEDCCGLSSKITVNWPVCYSKHKLLQNFAVDHGCCLTKKLRHVSSLSCVIIMTKMDESLEFMPRIMWRWIEQIFVLNFFRFQYVLAAATSIATKVNEETLTYLNQGQSYEIKLKKLGELSAYRGKILKVSIWGEWKMLLMWRVNTLFQMAEMLLLEWCLCMNWAVSVTKWWLQPGWSGFISKEGKGIFFVFITTNKCTINITTVYITTVSFYIIYTPTCFDISVPLSGSFTFVPCPVT